MHEGLLEESEVIARSTSTEVRLRTARVPTYCLAE